MRRPEDGNRDFDRKRGDQKLEVLDLDLAEPPDVASNQDSNHQGRRNDGKEEEH
jgi:hypothetical protein